ncbi:MAG: hypothetical protein AAGH65_10835, partial [Pseudomonadota bacterium]
MIHEYRRSQCLMPSLLHKAVKDSVKPTHSNPVDAAHFSRTELAATYVKVRSATEALIDDLGPE